MPPSVLAVRPGARRAAFTLIELLTVIAIIGILAAIIIPVVGRVRDSARAAQCVSNLRQLAGALRLYADENRGVLPPAYGATTPGGPVRDWPTSLGAYLPNNQQTRNPVHLCPKADYGSGFPSGRVMSYTYALLGGAIGFNSFNNDNDFASARKVSTIAHPSRALWITDAGHGGGANWPTAYNGITHGQMNSSIAAATPTTTTHLQLRHGDRANVAFADGSVRALARADFQSGYSADREVYLGRR